MINARRVSAAAIALCWAALSAALAWRTLSGVDAAARSREALLAARAQRGHSPTPAFPRVASAADAAALRGTESPLVLSAEQGRVVTSPVKDADDWEIIGAVAVPTRAAEQRTRVLLPVVLCGALLLAGSAIRRRRWAVLFDAGVLAVAVAGTAAQLTAARVALRATAALAPDLERLAFNEPSAGFAVLQLGLVAAAALLARQAARWFADNADRPARVRETAGAWAFIAPSLLHLLVFTIAPVGFLLWISVHDWDLLVAERPFVGLAHFREIFGDPLFWRALRNGLVYALYVPVTMVAALIAAMVLDQPLRGIKVLRVVVFLPYVASTVAIALVWQWLLHRDFGMLNAALAAVHLPRVDWLGNPVTALPAIMLVSAWCQLGYMMVVYLAGLQAIPISLIEAARLDGASAWQRFRLVTWPMLRPVSAYLLLTGIIWSFHGFTLVYVMTEGGPSHATDVLVYRIYQTAWEFRRFDVAAAMSVVLCLLLLALTALQWRVVKGEPADA